MTFPQLAQFSDLALLILRFMVGVIFLTGGSSQQKHRHEQAFHHFSGRG
jgi:uncharacterized membrane protein YphA (DoxX/SURF4 family)